MSRHDDLLELIDVRRLEWDPTEEPVGHTRTIDVIDQAEQHHTGARGPRSLSFDHKRRWLLAIERMHERDKGWSDIFYHLFVFADGEIWEGRDVLRTSQGNLGRAITFHIPGNNEVVTQAQYESTLAIARWATALPHNVRDHQQRPAATACSGTNGRINIARLRQELNMALTDLLPEDLSYHADFTGAEGIGLLTDNGQRVASRSVAGIVGYRVHKLALERELEMSKRVNQLVAQLASQDAQLTTLSKRVDGISAPTPQLSVEEILAAVRADIAADLAD